MSRGAPIRTERAFALPDRYRIKRHIATGGMASVWCAEDLVLDRSVAIKVLAERFAHDTLAVRRFEREARAAARVSGHRHVVTIYDVGEATEPGEPADATHTTGRAFIVMEFLAGGTVADAIRHDSVTRAEALRWLDQAASALDHAHARGIVHRDIKPANFLLDRTRVLHVADFGIARLTTEETITSSDQLFGTAAYLSPEQALGREATGASDRYALAVAAFELLAGQRPFSAPHFSAQARQHIEEPPPAASEIEPTLPTAVDEVLFGGLAKDPAARPQTAGGFVAELRDALSGRPPAGRATDRRTAPTRRFAADRVSAERVDPAAPVPSTAAARRRPDARSGPTAATAHDRPGPRRRVAALGALCLALALVAGIALVATRGHGSSARRLADRTTSSTATRHHRSVTAAPIHHVTRRTTASTPTTTTPTPEQLEAQGHSELLAGDYDSAIDTLRQAVAAASPSSPTYGYALYDLGRSELLDGDPQDAITVLRERLRVPGQRGTVQTLLDTALQQAGQTTGTGDGGASPAGSPTTPATPTTPAHVPAHPGQGSGGVGLGTAGNATGPADPPGPGNGDAQGAGPAAPSGRNATRAHHHHGFSPLLLLTAAAG